MTIYSLYIINKAGGLIYQTDFVSSAAGTNSASLNGKTVAPPRLTSNEYLVFAGTFHGIHAIASKISPQRRITNSLQDTTTKDPDTTHAKKHRENSSNNCSGIEILETETLKMQCTQTLTGLKFLIVSDPGHKDLDQVSTRIYSLYADFVMKNPFYTPEMPIRCDLFDQKLSQLVLSTGSTSV